MNNLQCFFLGSLKMLCLHHTQKTPVVIIHCARLMMIMTSDSFDIVCLALQNRHLINEIPTHHTIIASSIPFNLPLNSVIEYRVKKHTERSGSQTTLFSIKYGHKQRHIDIADWKGIETNGVIVLTQQLLGEIHSPTHENKRQMFKSN